MGEIQRPSSFQKPLRSGIQDAAVVGSNIAKSRALLSQSKVALENSRRVLADFLLTDIETALIFAKAAVEPSNSHQKQERNRKNARRGYDAVYFRKRVDLPESMDSKLRVRLRSLKSLLKTSGEQFPRD